MHFHLHEPLLVVIVSSLAGFGANLCKETVVRLIAYVGADYALLRFGKTESMHHHRGAIDRFLDD